ncbi:unnamed protein product [Prunus brigantina]
MLTLFPEVEESTLSKEVLGELPEIVAVVTEGEPWTLYFDGSFTLKGGGAGHLPATERIKIIGDSNLVLSQLQGSFAVKESTLAPYRTAAERLVNSFKQVVLEHIMRTSSRRNFDPLHRNDRSTSKPPREMKKQVAEVQANCPKCSTIPSTKESFTISFAEDWKAPYLAFFIDGTLPTNSKHTRKLKKTVKRYFIDGFRIPYKIVTDNGTPFVNKQVGSTLSGYGVKHRPSTPYYP